MQLTDEFVLTVYVEGNDLDTVAPALRTAFADFINSQSWPTDQVMLVDLRQTPDSTQSDYLPQWDLGLNLGMDHISWFENWFVCVESIVSLFQELSARTGQEFVMFLCFKSQPWRQEHLGFISTKSIDLEWLNRAIIRLTSS